MATLPNYAINVAQPFAEALKGYKLGMDLEVSQQEQMLKQQAAQQEMEQKRQTQAAFARLRQPGATAADYANLAMMLPEAQAKAVRESFSMLNSEKQSNILRQTGNVFAAFKSKQPEIAINLIDQQVAAMRNSGDEVGAKSLEMWGNVARQNPQAAEDYFGFVITQMPGGDKVIEGAVKLAAERRTEAQQPDVLRQKKADADKAVADAQTALATAANAQEEAAAKARLATANAEKASIEAEIARATQPFKISEAQSTSIIKAAEAKFAPDKFGAELGLTNAQIEASRAARRASDAAAAKSGAEAKRAQAEANQIASGVIPADKRPEAETKFRTEYNNQTKPFQEVKSAYGRVLSSEDSAVGDLSLIFGYMKMLDPGSVVREGEFATAQNAAGVPERVQNIYNRIISGERLNASQRDSFKGQAKKLYESAGQQEAVVRQGLERIAKGYGLNTANIFYTPTEVAPTAPGAPPGTPAPAPGGPITLRSSDGQSFTFPNQQAADAFKNTPAAKAAGVK